METTGINNWIEAARAAAKIQRIQARGQRREPPAPETFPEISTGQEGLRGLEQTQSLDAQDGKGKIINRYL